MLGCETPLQSVAVSLASGGFAGMAGLLGDFGLLTVIALAGGAALAGELAAHAIREDAGSGRPTRADGVDPE